MRYIKCLLLLCFLLVTSGAFCTEYGPNKFVNPSFESGMDGWHWQVSGDAKATCDSDTSVNHSGKASIRMHSESAFAPNVYGGIYQDVGGLVPGAKYLVSFYAKGNGVGASWCGGGPGWFTRKNLPTGDFDWTLVEMEIVVPDDAAFYHFRVNVDEYTKSLWLDDFSFRIIDPLTVVPKFSTVSLSKAVSYGLWLMPYAAKAPGIDGDLTDWDDVSPKLSLPQEVGNNLVGGWQGVNDLSATARVSWDDINLYLAFAVVDDVQSALPEIQPWDGDSIQIAVDPVLQRTHGNYGPMDVEFTLALTDAGKSRFEVTSVPQKSFGGFSAVKFAAKRVDNTTNYEIAIPFASLGIKPGTDWKGLGLTFLVNDNDKGGRKGYIELTPGIGRNKDPYQYVLLAPSDKPTLLLKSDTNQPNQDDDFVLQAVLYNPSTAPLGKIELTAERSEPKWTLSADVPKQDGEVIKLSTAIPAGTLLPGKSEITAVAANTKASLNITVSPDRDALRNTAKALQPLLGKAQKLATQAKSKHIATDYEDVVIATAEKFIGYALDDINNSRIARAEHIIAVLNTDLKNTINTLNNYLSGKAKPRITPRFVTSPVATKDGAFWADTIIPSTGRKEYRPVFFTGYGHFNRAIADIPNFTRLGCNIIQTEVGPVSTQPAESVLTNQPIKDGLLTALKSGEVNNVMVCWLTSPHYFPQWAIDKWPDIRTYYQGFLGIATDAPQARDIYRKHLEITLDTIRNSPALHSVCLSNEPVSSGWETDKFRLALWKDYVKRIYGNMDVLNSIAGTSYTSFGDVPVAGTKGLPKEENMTPLIYDQIRFNSERFSEFHAFLSDLVHIIRPGTPTHAKVMNVLADRNNLTWGCDVEQFAWMGDQNGNDCYHLWRGLGDQYAALWIAQNAYYDLQYSMRPVPIFNTENHIITDREQRLIPAEHTDCALWMGAIHGQGAHTIWVWERTNDRMSDFEGSILHRPENVIAVGHSGLDLMRLAPEVVKLQQAKAPVAILYSTTSQIWSQRAYDALFKAYEAFSFTGLPVRFISELQASNGGLEKYKAIILPAVGYLPDSVVTALKKYAAGGGKVWIVGDGELAKDEHGQLRKDSSLPKQAVSRFSTEISSQSLRDQFVVSMSKIGVKPLVTTKDSSKNIPWAVECRSASQGSSALVSIVNYWGKNQTVILEINGKPAKRVFDMRSSRYLPKGKLVLEPLKAMLLRVE